MRRRQLQPLCGHYQIDRPKQLDATPWSYHITTQNFYTSVYLFLFVYTSDLLFSIIIIEKIEKNRKNLPFNLISNDDIIMRVKHTTRASARFKLSSLLCAFSSP